ncbi:hypothetical protein NKDENANG_04150 [Candidatus Entotheonellaceae bacterium PAL068K]
MPPHLSDRELGIGDDVPGRLRFHGARRLAGIFGVSGFADTDNTVFVRQFPYVCVSMSYTSLS